MRREFTIGRVKRPFRPNCPACEHEWVLHEAQLPRQMHCSDCDCRLTLKWRYAWITWLIRLGDAAGRWGRGAP